MSMLREPFTFLNLDDHYLKALESPWYKNLVLFENLISEETMHFYQQKGLVTMHLPVTTGSISSPMGRGSDSIPVKVCLQGIDTYLADSMQFMLEYGCRLHEKGCYYLMPSIRGEQADQRHLCQFYHSEVEIPGALDDIMALAEEYLRYLAAGLLRLHSDRILACCGDVRHIEEVAGHSAPFLRLTFDEVEQIMKESHPQDITKYIQYEDGYRNITKLCERELAARFGVVWVTHYDQLAVPFYQKRDTEHIGCARNADLLIGIGETIGCGERHAQADELLCALQQHEVAPEEYGWYIEMKRRFPMQTSGFGMGAERFLMWVLKGTDIRNFQIFPRFNGVNILV